MPPKRSACAEPSTPPPEPPEQPEGEQPEAEAVRRSSPRRQQRDFYVPSPCKLLSEITADCQDRVVSGELHPLQRSGPKEKRHE